MLTVLAIFFCLLPQVAESSGDIVKFQGTVTRLNPYNLQDLGLNGVDAGNIEVSVNSVLIGSGPPVGTGVLVYRLSDLGAYIDFSVQTGDQVEVYGEYSSVQRISGPYLFKLVGSEHYLRKINPPPPTCSGIISVYVYDSRTNSPIPGASVVLSPSGVAGSTASNGYFSASGQCANTAITIGVSAQGYNPASQTVNTDASGNVQASIPLTPNTPLCQGAVSVYVYDSRTNSPIPGASVTLSPSGSSGSTASNGYYAATGQCANTILTIRCNTQGYNVATIGITTDVSGNAQVSAPLTPINSCQGTISGHVYDAKTKTPIKEAYVTFPPMTLARPTDSLGYFSTAGQFCPSTTQNLGCNAQGYKESSQMITTDGNGNAQTNFNLEPLTPTCEGIISGHVSDTNTKSPIQGAAILICQSGGDCWSPSPVDAVGAYSTGEQACPSTNYEITCSAEGYVSSTKTITTNEKGNAWQDFALEPESPKCEGTISGHVSDTNTKSPITGAILLICQQGGDCWSSAPVDSVGVYSSGEKACSSTNYEMTCSAESYKSATKTVTTDGKGNAWQDFALEPDCHGIISGHVSDSNTKSPIPGAVLLVCQQGKDCWSTPPVDSLGVYSTEEKACHSTTYEITCSAEGYKSQSITVTTDLKGNAWQDFYLEPEPKETTIILGNHTFTDYIPNEFDNLMRFFGSDLEVHGRLDAVLEPKEEIKNVKVDVQLGHIKAQHLSIFAKEAKDFDIFEASDDNAIPESFKQYIDWETKTFDMTSKDGVYSAELIVDATSVADIFKVLYMVYGGVDSLLEEAVGKVLPLTPDYDVYLTGDEPVYLYAEITKISGTDTSGNQFECPINEKIKTTYHKKVIALKEETLEKLLRAQKEGYLSM